MYQGYYLNLAENVKRREALVAHLAELGILDRYERLEAVNGRAVIDQYQTRLTAGNLGLWLTHVELLKKLLAEPCERHVHVLEDDAIFAGVAATYFDPLLEHADADLPDWDILFTDAFLSSADIETFRRMSSVMETWRDSGRIALLEMQPMSFFGTTSMFFNRRSIGKLAEWIGEPWKQDLNIDFFLLSLIQSGRLKAYLTAPFLTSLAPDTLDSDIRENDAVPSLQLAVLYRRAFFHDANLPALEARVNELVKDVPLSPWAQLYLQTLRLRVSDQWRFF